jgi:hypothetical protein
MTTDPQTARRARIVAAIKSSPFEELRTVDHAPNGPLQITVRVDDLADTLLRALPAPAGTDDTDLTEADIDRMMAAGVPVQIVTAPPQTHAAGHLTVTQAQNFHEPDEDPAAVQAAFEAGEKGVTTPATADRPAEEAYRLAVSAALRLGTGAPWEAIRDRAEDLTAEVEQLTETSRRLLEQRQEMAAERFVWQERGDRAESRVRQLEAAAPVDRATVEEHRLALSDALGLGTGAPWDAIRDRVTELALPPLGQDPVARRLGLVAEHRATVLNEAAAALDGLTQETAAADMTMPEGRWRAGLDAGIRELRRLADEERDEWEAQTHLDQLVEDVCRPVVIGGEIVRVHGAVEMSDESRAALAEVTAIVKRRMADEAQQQTETPCCSDPTCACVQVNAAGRCDCARWDDAPLPIRYRNWRGETADRKILPIRVWFGATDWHPEPQWFLRAVDVDRGVERDFALADMHDLPAVVPAGAGEEPADETRTLAAMFEGLHTLLATSSRDWGTYRVDAWLWAVLCGWDCEQAVHDETCTHGALEEMQQQHGWDDEAVAKARRYRAVVRAIEDRAAVPQPGKEH